MKYFATVILFVSVFISSASAQSGCTTSASLDITIEECIGTKDVSLVREFKVSPNPGDGAFVVTIESNITSPAHIVVADNSGRTIYLQPIQLHGMTTLPLQLTQVPAGTYFVSLHYAGRVKVQQVVKL